MAAQPSAAHRIEELPGCFGLPPLPNKGLSRKQPESDREEALLVLAQIGHCQGEGFHSKGFGWQILVQQIT